MTPAPRDNGLLVVRLHDNWGGEEMEYETSWHGGDNPLWYFTEGNMGCDCNRGLVFGDDSVPCGETRFELLSLVWVHKGGRREVLFPQEVVQ